MNIYESPSNYIVDIRLESIDFFGASVEESLDALQGRLTQLVILRCAQELDQMGQHLRQDKKVIFRNFEEKNHALLR